LFIRHIFHFSVYTVRVATVHVHDTKANLRIVHNLL